MKQIQLLTTQTAIPITVTVATPSLEVSGLNPLTVCAVVVGSAASSANISAQLEGSLDGANWAAVGSPTVITANGSYALKDSDAAFAHYRINYTVTGGTLTATTTWLVYGNSI